MEVRSDAPTRRTEQEDFEQDVQPPPPCDGVNFPPLLEPKTENFFVTFLPPHDGHATLVEAPLDQPLEFLAAAGADKLEDGHRRTLPNRRSGGRDRPGVGQELFDADIGQRVTHHLLEHRERHRRDVGAKSRSLHDVQRRAHAGDDDLGGEVVIAQNLQRLLDHLHPLVSGIVEAPDKGADERRTGLGREQHLRRREHKGHVDA